VLIVESAWKVIWMVAIGVPHHVAGDITGQLESLYFNVSLGVVILAVVPWDHVWRRYVLAPAEEWH
jgi:hypothetical protein